MRKQSRTARVFNASLNAFTLIEILVVIAVIALLAFVLIPGMIRTKREHRRMTCVENLREIGLAFKIWAPDSRDVFPMGLPVAQGGTKELIGSGKVFSHFQAMSNELSTPNILVCPFDRQRSPAVSFTNGFGNTNLSYFVGVDARDSDPENLLGGDRNLTNQLAPGSRLVFPSTKSLLGWSKEMHSERGNVLLADGSVQYWTNEKLQQAVQALGTNVSRLAVA